jgi:hypothetical protein
MSDQPSMATVKTWFKDKVISRRTASAGFSGNRLWKSPQAIVRGNTEDPNGLCGDAAAYVAEAFYKDLGSYETSDGFQIGVVLWSGTITNHIANALLLKKPYPQSYRWNATAKAAVQSPPTAAGYSSAYLLRVVVLDLYYKEAPQTLETWWKERSAAMDGTIKIGFIYNIDS